MLLKVDLHTGVVVEEKYIRNGRLHRDPKRGPAEVWRDAKTGFVVRDVYRWRGMKHNDRGPAETTFTKDGHLAEQWWFRKGIPFVNSTVAPVHTIWRGGRIVHEDFIPYRYIKKLRPKIRDPKPKPIDAPHPRIWNREGTIAGSVNLPDYGMSPRRRKPKSDDPSP